jgi:hypothetical protein
MIRSLVGSSILFPGIVSQLLAEDSAGKIIIPDSAGKLDPLAPRAPHFPARAKRVIFLYMSGGVSHVDSFDPKPKLISDVGKTASGPPSTNPLKHSKAFFLKAPQWTFRPGGMSGTQVSDLFPHIRECVDDICMIRSLQGDHNNHAEATLGMHTGSVTLTRPSMGSWISYGLGTMNRNLPAFVVLAPQLPYTGEQVWGSDFLPPCHQGTRVIPGGQPIPDLTRREPTASLQDLELSMLRSVNQRHLAQRDNEATLAARIRSFETAAGMQQEAPEAFDLSKETDATLALYGLRRGSTAGFGWQCLVARRLAERGVRFIELIDVGASNNWDAHGDMLTHTPLAKNVDKPIAGLLRDLKSRGMLDDTLVVWTTEFGRTPMVANKSAKGREHHSACFTSWMAGAGTKGGYVHGASDDYGINIAQDDVHVHDFHATILHLMGLNHERLTYRHAGRDFRLTDVSGKVVEDVIA